MFLHTQQAYLLAGNADRVPTIAFAALRLGQAVNDEPTFIVELLGQTRRNIAVTLSDSNPETAQVGKSFY